MKKGRTMKIEKAKEKKKKGNQKIENLKERNGLRLEQGGKEEEK